MSEIWWVLILIKGIYYPSSSCYGVEYFLLYATGLKKLLKLEQAVNLRLKNPNKVKPLTKFSILEKCFNHPIIKDYLPNELSHCKCIPRSYLLSVSIFQILYKLVYSLDKNYWNKLGKIRNNCLGIKLSKKHSKYNINKWSYNFGLDSIQTLQLDIQIPIFYPIK